LSLKYLQHAARIANPLTVVEQITYLLFIKRFDEIEKKREAKLKLKSQEAGKALFGEDQQESRWSRFKDVAPQRMGSSPSSRGSTGTPPS